MQREEKAQAHAVLMTFAVHGIGRVRLAVRERDFQIQRRPLWFYSRCKPISFVRVQLSVERLEPPADTLVEFIQNRVTGHQILVLKCTTPGCKHNSSFSASGSRPVVAVPFIESG